MYLLLYEWRGDNKPEWRGYKVFTRRGGDITNQYPIISSGALKARGPGHVPRSPRPSAGAEKACLGSKR